MSVDKIQSWAEVARRTRAARSENKQVVFTNGCFDILHVGHVRYLQQARNLGDLLVVGLNSDRSVKALKGESRPIVPEGERAEVLAALAAVDLVALFDEDTPLELIRTVIPDILVKGGDYREEDIVGRDVVLENGGRVQVIAFVPGASSTNVIDRIHRRRDG